MYPSCSGSRFSRTAATHFTLRPVKVKNLRFAVLCAVIGITAIAIQPRAAAAQCTEKCLGLLNEGGGWMGYSCVFGTQGHDCQAQYLECRITCTNCGCDTETILEPVLDADGVPAGVTERCRITGKIMSVKSVVTVQIGAMLARAPQVKESVRAENSGGSPSPERFQK